MSIGTNIQYIRKINQLTQEQFASKMNITRQTVSKWESDEVKPDLSKLIELAELFSLSLDELILKDLRGQNKIYSKVHIKTLPASTIARYVIISADPENDVQNYMRNWAIKNRLHDFVPNAMLVGWDFPFISTEQQMRFNLHGYAAGYLLPQNFDQRFEGVEYKSLAQADYAVITIKDPFVQAFERIPNGYKRIMEYLKENGYKEKKDENILACFEYEYDVNGIHYMDVYMHAAK